MKQPRKSAKLAGPRNLHVNAPRLIVRATSDRNANRIENTARTVGKLEPPVRKYFVGVVHVCPFECVRSRDPPFTGTMRSAMSVAHRDAVRNTLRP